MALQVPQYLENRSPEYLYDLLKVTYQHESKVTTEDPAYICSNRPYDMRVCHSSQRNGIRFGSFDRCNFIGTMCKRGEFYSKMITVNGVQYELRAGVFTEGQHVEGKHGVTLVDAADTKFVGQSLDQWTNTYGDTVLLSSALTQACTLVEEPFSRTSYKPPQRTMLTNAGLETVTSVTTVESGFRVYCDYSSPPESMPTRVIIPELASWWHSAFESLIDHLRPNRHFGDANETAAID